MDKAYHLFAVVLAWFVWALTRLPRPIATWLIRIYLKVYPVRMSECAQTDITAYKTFNEFFTRPLASDQRNQLAKPDVLYSPVDGVVGQFGCIEDGQIIQAKGIAFDLEHLCGPKIAHPQQGHFINFYLGPADYHRVHMPAQAQLHQATRIGGELISVSLEHVARIPNLYTRNRRMVAQFHCQWGTMTIIMVAARNVSAIQTPWSWSRRGDSLEQSCELAALAELGRFNLGSTVVVLFDFPIQWTDNVRIGTALLYGQTIAEPREQTTQAVAQDAERSPDQA